MSGMHALFIPLETRGSLRRGLAAVCAARRGRRDPVVRGALVPFALATIFVMVFMPPPAAAQVTATDLAGVSLEELMNIRVTIAARTAQPVEHVPAAIYVVTREDIRRSGLTTLPEIFRLVPGMQVAQVNGNKWAATIRGFNNVHANKALILIDGRSIYNRAFSGVFWEAQDLLVADIERIEVVRGPGSAVWGSNAVNGIINIITRSAADTKGTLVDLSAGTFERSRLSVRYGGTAGPVNYRVYSQLSDYADARTFTGQRANDRWNSLMGGYRTDWTRGRDEVNTQAHLVVSEGRPNWIVFTSPDPAVQPAATDRLSEVSDLSLQGRWTRSRASGDVFTLQSYIGSHARDEAVTRMVERTVDVDLHYQARSLGRHDAVFGGGYRRARLAIRENRAIGLSDDANDVVNVFLQDDVRLHRAVTAALGSKLERDSHAGWSWLPSARVMWHWPRQQHLWAGVARARRTPSTLDREVQVVGSVSVGSPLPIVQSFLGNPDFRSERLWQAEAGYRVSVGGSADVEVATFYGLFDDAQNLEVIGPIVEPLPPPAHLRVVLQPSNRRNITSRGVEINGRWVPFEAWRLNASYSGLWMRSSLDLPEGDRSASAPFENSFPHHQWQLHSSVLLPRKTRVDGSVYRISRLVDIGVPAYVRVDLGVEVPLSSRLSLHVAGQNLSRARHQEFVGAGSILAESLIPRSARVTLRWQH